MGHYGVHCYDNFNQRIDSFYYATEDEAIRKIQCMSQILPRVFMTDGDDCIILEFVNGELIFPVVS